MAAHSLEEELELGSGCKTVGDLLKERESLKKRLRTSQERLRKLRMVKIHCSKVPQLTLSLRMYSSRVPRIQVSLDKLAALTSKWRCVAQTAAEQLVATVHPPPSMTEMLTYMHIDPSLIHYCPLQDTFY